MWITNSFSNQKCRLAMAQEAMASYNFFMGVQKNSPFIEPLNKEYVICHVAYYLKTYFYIIWFWATIIHLLLIIDHFGGVRLDFKNTGKRKWFPGRPRVHCNTTAEENRLNLLNGHDSNWSNSMCHLESSLLATRWLWFYSSTNF